MSVSKLKEQAFANPPAWATEKLLTWDDEAFRNHQLPFALSEYWIDQGSINIFNVVGSLNGEQAGLSWLELLLKDQLHEGELSSSAISFISQEGLYYFIERDEDQQVLYAKFHLDQSGQCMLHGVNIHHYTIDYAFQSLFNALREEILNSGLNVEISMKKQLNERRDGPGWKEDRFTLSLIWLDRATKNATSFSFEEAQQKLQEMIKLRILNEIAIQKKNTPLLLSIKLFIKDIFTKNDMKVYTQFHQ